MSLGKRLTMSLSKGELRTISRWTWLMLWRRHGLRGSGRVRLVVKIRPTMKAWRRSHWLGGFTRGNLARLVLPRLWTLLWRTVPARLWRLWSLWWLPSLRSLWSLRGLCSFCRLIAWYLLLVIRCGCAVWRLLLAVWVLVKLEPRRNRRLAAVAMIHGSSFVQPYNL